MHDGFSQLTFNLFTDKKKKKEMKEFYMYCNSLAFIFRGSAKKAFFFLSFHVLSVNSLAQFEKKEVILSVTSTEKKKLIWIQRSLNNDLEIEGTSHIPVVVIPPIIISGGQWINEWVNIGTS